MKRTIYVVCIITLLSAITVLPAAAATTWDVYEGDSIQAALNNASDGDTVFVHAGTYVLTGGTGDWRLFLDTPNVTLKGEDANKVILDGMGKGVIGLSHYGAPSGCIIEGFKITNGTVGVRIVEDDSPNCIIRNNIFEDLSSSAVGTNAPNTTIIGNVINGGSVYIAIYGSDCKFMNNFVSNITNSNCAIQFFEDSGGSYIANNTIINSTGTRALTLRSGGSVVINNTIINNAGDAIRLWKTTAANNIIMKNNFSSNGGILYLRDAGEGNKIYLNNIVDNTAGVTYEGTPPAVTYWNSTELIEYVYGDSTYTNYLGNYWGSDYTGPDADGDGIGDTPYDIPGNATDKDYRPLMAPFEQYPAPNGAGLADTAWPTFGHDLRNTGQSPYVGPQESAVKWAVNFTDGSGGMIAQPVIGADGTIYIGTHAMEGTLHALNPDGTEKWAFQPDGGPEDYSAHFETAPVLAEDGTIYVGATFPGEFWDGKLYALDPDDGSVKWQFTTTDWVYADPKIGADGTIYFADDTRLHAVNPDDGSEKWNVTTGGRPYYGSLAVGADYTIYIHTLGTLYAINPNGTEKWNYTISGVGSNIAVADDGTIYIARASNGLCAVYPNGTEKWSVGYACYGLAIGADGTLYGGTGGGICAIDPADGSVKWQFAASGSGYHPPAIGADSTVYFGGSSAKKIYAVNPDGTEKWSFATEYRVESSPAIGADGTLYVPTGGFDSPGGWSGSKLYAFGPPLAGLCGDVNNDGRVTMGDGRLIYLNVIYGDDEYPLANPWTADVNGDGRITMGDGRLVYLNVIYGDEEYPLECGS